MATDKSKTETPEGIPVNSATVRGSLYSQVVSVTITDLDLTLEFAFINPRSKSGEVVARITLPRPAGDELAKAIIETVKKHEETKKEGK